MAQLLDMTGGKLDWVLHKGIQKTFTIQYYDSTETLVTNISSARIGFFTGSSASPTAAFTDISITPSVGSSTTITFTITSTHTRAFTAGSPYNYVLETTLADGTIETVLHGDIAVKTEIVT